MADFNYASADPDEDRLANHAEARRLRDYLNAHGRDARIEHSGDYEYRVWVQHPKFEDTFAYVNKSDKGLEHSEPYWVAK